MPAMEGLVRLCVSCPEIRNPPGAKKTLSKRNRPVAQCMNGRRAMRTQMCSSRTAIRRYVTSPLERKAIRALQGCGLG